MEIPPNFYYMMTPFLIITTYFSAYKNGKVTCDKFLTNSFLYLITSFSIYLTSYQYTKENMNLSDNTMLFLSVAAFVPFILFMFTDNVALKHLLWTAFLILTGAAAVVILRRYDAEMIQDIFKKLMVILVICAVFAVSFPQYIKPSMGTALFVGLLFVILFRLIDMFFYNNQYDNIISSIAVFIFSGFVVYDTDRIIKQGKECAKTGNANYLDNMVDMFLNIINLFFSLAGMED